MNVRIVSIALWLMLIAVPQLVRAQTLAADSCPSTATKLAAPIQLTLPEDAKTTAREIAFDVDVGSDGRVRGVQLDESSGDGAVDLNLQQLLQAASYLPAQTGCVAYSAGLRVVYELPATSSPQPARHQNVMRIVRRTSVLFWARRRAIASAPAAQRLPLNSMPPERRREYRRCATVPARRISMRKLCASRGRVSTAFCEIRLARRNPLLIY